MYSRTTFALLITALVAIATGLATLTPASSLPGIGGSDKLHHMLAFAALALPVACMIPRRIPLTALLLTAYGAVIEMLQPLAGRSRDLEDQLANMAGICIGVVLGLMIYALFLRPGARMARPAANPAE